MNEQRRRKRGENYREVDPSPLEIWAACHRIRQGWSESERIARRDLVHGSKVRRKR